MGFRKAATLIAMGVVAGGIALLPGKTLSAGPTPGPELAAVDKAIIDWKLQDVTHDRKEGEKESAAMVDLATYRGRKNVVLFFMSEKCGTTWKYEKRVGAMLKQAPKQDVVWLGVKSSALDTPESIRKYAEFRHFDMPVLDDARNRMANYFKTRVTPTFIVIDKKGVMRYIGSFDDNPAEETANKHYLPDAVSAVVSGKEVPVKKTTPFG